MTQRIPLSTTEADRLLFYLSHHAALARGDYAEFGLDVSHTVCGFGKGPDRLVAGGTDVLLAAPMMTMKRFSERGDRLVAVATVTARHPFRLVGRTAAQDFSLTDLAGKVVFDFAEAATPKLALRWALNLAGIKDGDVHWIPGVSAGESISRFLAGEADFLLHPVDTIQPLIDGEEAFVVADLADIVGDIPFTVLAVRPDTLRRRMDDIVAFVAGFSQALDWLASASTGDVVRTVAHMYGRMPPEVVGRGFDANRRLGVYPQSVTVDRSAFESFHRLLRSVDWFANDAPYEALVAPDVARHALARRGCGDIQ